MKRQRILWIAILGLFTITCLAQTQPAAATQDTQASVPTITKQTSLVLVDTVVTDKQGHYLRDLTQKDFRVWEDNKEQTIKNFSFETDPGGPNSSRKHYMILFFDNSTMNVSDQAQARDAALKFLDANAGANRYIAIADFGGTLHISQNFTTDAARLKEVVRTLKFSSVAPTSTTSSVQAVPPPALGIPQLGDAEADFGVRTLLLALRNMAKGLTNVPGRKTLVLFSSGFPLNPSGPDTVERESELTAAIDACNKANVAVYPVDPRGLTTPVSDAPELQLFPDAPGELVTAVLRQNSNADDAPTHLVYVQRGGTSGGTGGGHTGGGVASTGGHGTGTGSTGGTRGTGNTGGTRAGGTTTTTPLPVAPYSQSRGLVPATDITNNQQVLYELAAGTGGFVIVNSNDLLGGIDKIAREQNEYYVLGYTPPESDEGSCHILKVKVDLSDTKVRSRSGYCNIRPKDLLAGKPVEKQLQNEATGSQPGNVAASMLAPYFYTSANTARVNLAIEIPSSAIKFDKEKGKQHAEVNVLGIAYSPDGTVAARFSDNVEFNFDDKDQVKEFGKNPYQYENQFDIGSGHYNLKVVFSSGGESFGKLEMPLVVDNYDASKFSMSSLALSKELHPVNQSAASLDAALLEDRTPLVAQGMEVIPTGDDHFKQNDPAVFYAEFYDPLLTGTNPPKVGIQMLVIDVKSHQKKVEMGGPLPAASPGTQVIPFGMKLPMDQLPPGSYELQVRGTDTAGNYTKVRVADFQVE